MTETLQRPSRSPLPPPPAGRARTPHSAGTVGAVWAGVVGLVVLCLPVLLVWVVDTRSGADAADALRTAGQVWLVVHGASLEVPGGRYGLTPLGLLLVPLLLLARAGAHGARECATTTLQEGAVLVGWIASGYAVLTAVVAALVAGGPVSPAPFQALLGGATVAAVGASAGVVVGAGLLGRLGAALPERVPAVVRGTAAAAAALLAAGALLAGVSLALSLPAAVDLARASGPGVVGGFALLLAGLALVPNAAVWGASWLAGPGFAVGVDTSVGPFGHELGPVPALPLLAALPEGALPTGLGVVVLAVPVLAGVLGGAVVARSLRGAPRLRRAGAGALVGPCAGLVMAFLAWLSGGPAGGDRLTAVGPSPWQVGLCVTALVGLGALLAAPLWRSRPVPD